MKHKYRKRNFLDIILTDSRPVELPLNYSTSYFYEYLSEQKECEEYLSVIKNECRAFDSINDKKNINDIWGTNWHSVPLKYHIYKNRFEHREMSLISPLAMIEMAFFVGAYGKQLITLTSAGGFSIRKHKESEKLSYVKMINGHGISYRQDNGLDLFQTVEASGSYFDIYPYKLLSYYHKSSAWYKTNREYSYYGKIDYNKCFDSVYSHTYTWIVTRSTVDGRSYGENQYILNLCDKFLQNINGSQTNGIVVGPECSRLLIEILLQEIDNSVKQELLKDGLIFEDTYVIHRYVDDIYIFADDEKTIEKIIKLYIVEAERYRLRLNDNKQKIGKLPTIWFDWKEKIIPVKEYIINCMFADNESVIAIKCRKTMISNMKMLYQDLLALYLEDQKRIAAYILSTIYNKIKNEKRTMFNPQNTASSVERFLDLVFYFYSFSPSYNNTEKLICILYIVKKEIPDVVFCDVLTRIIGEYASAINKANMEDIVDLLLLLGLHNIELPNAVEKNLLAGLQCRNNPVLYVIGLLCIKEPGNKNAVKRMIDINIKSAVNNIYNKKNFFMYDEAWWFYIFSNCPLLSNNTLSIMNTFLEEVLDNIKEDINSIPSYSKRAVISFLLDDRYEYKFINWGLTKESIFKDVEFKTYNRMLVNGYNIRNDILDVEDDLDY